MTISTVEPSTAAERRPESPGSPDPGRRFALACYATGQLVLLGWWLAFHPGLMSPDSVTYVEHVTTGPWVAGQSVAYDALLGLCLRLTGDVSAVTLLQTAGMAAALAHLAGALTALGPPGRWLLVAVGCATLSPPLGAFTVAIWKDVPFTICAVLAAGTAIRLASGPASRTTPGPASGSVLRAASGRGTGRGAGTASGVSGVSGTASGVVPARRRGGSRRRRRPARTGRGTIRDRRLVALGAELVGLGLFRHNGFLVALIAAVLLALLLPAVRRWLAVVAAVSVTVPALLLGAGYPALGIAPPSRTFAYQTVFGDLAVAYGERPELFGREERALLEAIAPPEAWRRGATCQTMARIFFDPAFGHTEAERRISDVLRLWRGLLVRAPGLMLGTRVCRAALAWQIDSTAGEPGGELYRFSPHDPRLPAAWEGTGVDSVMRQRPFLPVLRTAGLIALDASTVRQFEWLLWRAPLWCYLCYAAAALARRRTGSGAALAGAAVVAGQQLGVILTNTAPDFRFMVTPILVGIVLVPLLAWEARALVARR
ncbi:hypothetical protein ACLQ2R_23520 [Streptosporangium sp. DT93]|uniref:hypothetical protein n=1 Tax=Streptosporangium sp. DT93 TaxID=3393428 RepID=UPI003CE8C1C6